MLFALLVFSDVVIVIVAVVVVFIVVAFEDVAVSSSDRGKVVLLVKVAWQCVGQSEKIVL